MCIDFRDARRRAEQAIVSVMLVLALTACTHTQGTDASLKPAPAYEVIPGLTPPRRVEEAIRRLQRGESAQARAELLAALAVDPGNVRAHRLMTEIDVDPKVLLGEKNYPYRVRPGETLWGLSQRLLGDPLLFYALARYNGIETPEDTAGGRMLLIPGTPKKAPPPQRKRPPVARAAASPAPAATPAPALQAPAGDPAQASRLRGVALEHMSRGQIDLAESLLQQARSLDPGSAVIQADLDRARRIQASVRPRS